MYKLNSKKIIIPIAIGILIGIIIVLLCYFKNASAEPVYDKDRIDTLREQAETNIEYISNIVDMGNDYLKENDDRLKKIAIANLGSYSKLGTADDGYEAPHDEQEPFTTYDGAIYEITGSTDGKSNSHWIDTVIFDVYKAYLYVGALPSVTLAQGWVESACFSSEGATQCHNYFGIKWKGTATNPKGQDLNAPYPTKPNGESVKVEQLGAAAYFTYFNTPLEGFVMYAADPEHYYGYANTDHYHTMLNAMHTGNYHECLSGRGKEDLMTWVGTGNDEYPIDIENILLLHKLYLFDDEAYMVAYLRAHGLYDGVSGIEIQGHTFYPGNGNYTFCSRNHVNSDLTSISFGGGATAREGTIPIDKLGNYR